MPETVVSISSVSCTVPSKVFARANTPPNTHEAARLAGARKRCVLPEMTNRYRQKKMGSRPSSCRWSHLSRTDKKPHAQRLREFSIFERVLQSATARAAGLGRHNHGYRA
ncbi:hypothetical protein Busp01_46710 [Trinickia caryophylli]|nr:hypothetical protein Busp01_46710 [Trinickia caryophylli]